MDFDFFNLITIFFSDKYGDIVRVVTMGDSIELCAGTHIDNTKNVGRFAIASVENKGTDTYRVTAATDNNIVPILKEEISKYNEEMIRLLDKAKRIINEAKENDIDLEFNFNSFSVEKLSSLQFNSTESLNCFFRFSLSLAILLFKVL